jgi:hypothetical protein
MAMIQCLHEITSHIQVPFLWWNHTEYRPEDRATGDVPDVLSATPVGAMAATCLWSYCAWPNSGRLSRSFRTPKRLAWSGYRNPLVPGVRCLGFHICAHSSTSF